MPMFGDPGHPANNNQMPLRDGARRLGLMLISVGLIGTVGLVIALLLLWHPEGLIP